MSSSWLARPVARGSRPPVSFWSEDTRGLAEEEDSIGELIYTNKGLKHISISGDLLVCRDTLPGSQRDAEPLVGEVRGVALLPYCKMVYGELSQDESLPGDDNESELVRALSNKLLEEGLDSEDSTPFRAKSKETTSFKNSLKSRRVRPSFYITLKGNPYEEVSETLYFDSIEQQSDWRDRFSLAPVVHTNFEQRYSVREKLNYGGVARVYLVEERSTGKLFAAKSLDLEKCGQFPHTRELLTNEVEILKRLRNCQHVPKFREVHQGKGTILLLTDHIGGCSLGQWIVQRALESTLTQTPVVNVMRY